MLCFCNDLGGLITLIKNKRQVTDVHLKFGIDGAGGFLKLCLSIQSIDDDDDNSLIDSGRRKYKDVAISTEFQDSKVKNLFIIGLAQSVQENYHNVFLLWRAIHINEFDGTIATDLKLANILSGLMSHSSQNPCTWCEAQKGALDERTKLRTIGDIRDNYLNWMANGGNRKNAKNFALNCRCLQRIPISWFWI